MCSGAMVFLDSFSHISLASDERRWMNSMAEKEVNINATEILGILVLPTQHSITRSRVSFAHVTSSGNSSKSSRGREFKTISYGTSPAADGGDASKKMDEREGNEMLEVDPHLESFLPQSPWAKTARHRSGHCVPLCRTWLKVDNGCNMKVGWLAKEGWSIIIRTKLISS